MKLVKLSVVLLVLISLMGTAQAWNVALKDMAGNDLTPDPLHMNFGQTIKVGVGHTAIPDKVVSIEYQIVGIYPNDGSITVNLLKPNSAAVGPGLAPFIENDVVSIKMENSADPNVDYNVRIGAVGKNATGGIYTELTPAGVHVQAVHGVNVPEFPTVALPIAAILGLAFFMQRRKEE